MMQPIYIKEGMEFPIYNDLLKRLAKEFLIQKQINFDFIIGNGLDLIKVFYKDTYYFSVCVSKNKIIKIITH